MQKKDRFSSQTPLCRQLSFWILEFGKHSRSFICPLILPEAVKIEFRISSRNWTHTLSLQQLQGIKFELIFTLWTVVSNIMGDFQNCHSWAWDMKFEKRSSSCISFPPLTAPVDQNLAYFHSTSSMRKFPKLQHMGIKPGPGFTKLLNLSSHPKNLKILPQSLN